MPNPTTIQPQSQQQDPNQTRAALGIGTQILQHLIPNEPPQNTPQAPQPQETAPQQEKAPEPKEQPKEDIGAKITEMQLEFTKQLDAMRQEMKQDQAKEMELIKSQITQALAEDESHETQKPA